MGIDLKPPSRVTLVYRPLRNGHEFFAREVRGLMIQSADLRKAYDAALLGLSRHISVLTGIEVNYEPEKSFDEFKRELEATSPDVAANIGVPLVGLIHEKEAA